MATAPIGQVKFERIINPGDFSRKVWEAHSFILQDMRKELDIGKVIMAFEYQDRLIIATVTLRDVHSRTMGRLSLASECDVTKHASVIEDHLMQIIDGDEESWLTVWSTPPEASFHTLLWQAIHIW